jgi:hypothetical protein
MDCAVRSDTSRLPKHLKIGIHPPLWIYHKGQGIYLASPGKTTAEEISQGYLYGGFGFTVRIDNACQMMLHSGLSLKEISEKTGYTNQYYFSSCFKKKTGQSPSEYRKPVKSLRGFIRG